MFWLLPSPSFLKFLVLFFGVQMRGIANEIGRFFISLKYFFPFPKPSPWLGKTSCLRRFNWDDLHRRAKLALRANDSHLASWLISKQQMLIRCTLGRHPSQEVHDTHAKKDREGHTERRTVDRDWRLALLPLTKTSDWKRFHLLH